MAKDTLTIQNYLCDIQPDFTDLVMSLHDCLVGHGCAVSLKEAKSGHVVSFTHTASKRVVANFVARKTGPQLRLYADNLESYRDLIPTLPPSMLERIAKAPICRRLHDPAKCNSHCLMGYLVTIDGTEHKKCRNGCFLLPITAESTPALLALVEREMVARAAA